MKTIGIAAALALTVMCTAACTSDASGETGAERGPIGKADSAGSCSGHCGGRGSTGSCWCDSGCRGYGDCCDNYGEMCLGEPPEGGGDSGSVPELGTSASRELVVVADSSDGLDVPRDLAFHPDRPNELWVVNRETDGTAIIFNPGKSTQRVDVRVDAFANHFMEEVSSIAFGANDTFGTCQESRNTYNDMGYPNDFMGPTLWPADLDIYAEVNQDPSGEMLGSHIDMLHQSPLCMGIEHQEQNAYWVFDGKNGHVVYYDFQRDHGPGYDDHSDGIVRRYVEARVTRRSGVPSHLVLDRSTGWLYVADTGGHRIIRLDVSTGRITGYLPLTNEPLEEYSVVQGVTVETFVSGLSSPSGLEIDGNRLFVSDYATGEIIVYDTSSGDELGRASTNADGIMGITLGPDGKLWYVDGVANTLTRIDP